MIDVKKPTHEIKHPQKHFGLRRVMEEADLPKKEFERRVIKLKQFRGELKVERLMLSPIIKNQNSSDDIEEEEKV